MAGAAALAKWRQPRLQSDPAWTPDRAVPFGIGSDGALGVPGCFEEGAPDQGLKER
jgi:hypothetical protein